MRRIVPSTNQIPLSVLPVVCIFERSPTQSNLPYKKYAIVNEGYLAFETKIQANLTKIDYRPSLDKLIIFFDQVNYHDAIQKFETATSLEQHQQTPSP